MRSSKEIIAEFAKLEAELREAETQELKQLRVEVDTLLEKHGAMLAIERVESNTSPPSFRWYFTKKR